MSTKRQSLDFQLGRKQFFLPLFLCLSFLCRKTPVHSFPLQSWYWGESTRRARRWRRWSSGESSPTSHWSFKFFVLGHINDISFVMWWPRKSPSDKRGRTRGGWRYWRWLWWRRRSWPGWSSRGCCPGVQLTSFVTDSWNKHICTYLRTSKVTTWIEDDFQDDIELISFTRSYSFVSALFQSVYSFHFMVWCNAK